MHPITVSEIFITVTVVLEVSFMRDNTKSGALTEVTFYILLSLYTPRHGYAVMQFIEDKTKGQLLLGAGTLYGALTSLEKKVGSRPMAIWKKEKKNIA